MQQKFPKIYTSSTIFYYLLQTKPRVTIYGIACSDSKQNVGASGRGVRLKAPS